MTFNPVATAFSGFGLLARRWQAFLLWIVTFVAAVVLTTIVTFIASMFVARQSASVVAGVIIAVVAVYVIAVIVAAIQRVVLRPKDIDYAGVRFGGAELWTLAAIVVLMGVQLAVSMGNLALLQALGQQRAAWAQYEGYAVNFLALLLISPFSLLVPAVFDRGRAGWRLAWELGRGHRVKLLGMAAITGGLYLGLSLAAVVAMRNFTGEGAPGGGLMWLTILAGFLTYAASLVIVVAPGATAYATLIGPTNRVEEVFD